MRLKDGLDDLEKRKSRAPTGIRSPDNPTRRVVAIPTALVTIIVTQSSKAFRLTSVHLEVRHPRCVGSNKGIFVYYTSSLTQLYYLN